MAHTNSKPMSVTSAEAAFDSGTDRLNAFISGRTTSEERSTYFPLINALSLSVPLSNAASAEVTFIGFEVVCAIS